ncbi:MAG: flagellar biosynthesis protein FlgJ [Desulfuromonadales bacterium]|nr:MAG: flagellar biosynthesis protein FlgJ [Desulfuromonadales bacterium]
MQTTIPTDTLMQESEATRARQLAARGGAVSDRERKSARKVAQDFEAMMVGMMVKSMRETVGTDTLTGGGKGEETFRSMLDQEYATAFAAQGGLGIAPLIEKQIIGDLQRQKPKERMEQGGAAQPAKGDSP